MIQIRNTLISSDVIESKFICDVSKCKGACCVYGDSGAPLEKEEKEILQRIYTSIKPFLRQEGITTIEKIGTSVIDNDGDLVTPLIEGKECVYTYFENNIVKCAIEKAFNEKVINFQKPISCHLFPIRVKIYPEFIAVNYERIEFCKDAMEKGENENRLLFKFLKDSLIRRFGEKWYDEINKLEKEKL